MTRPTVSGIPSGVKTEIPTPPAWAEPLSAYLDWLRGARRSEATIYQHSYTLRRFAASTGLDPWPMSLAQLSAYMAANGGLSASALRTKRQVLRGFYSWGMILGHWPENPADRLPTVSSPRSVPRPAPEHSVRVGLSATDPRSRLLVRLAVQVGMRCREICQVSREDVIPDLVGHSLRVFGKGEHIRIVPLPPALAHELLGMPPGYLFPGNIDGHLSPARVSELISEALPPGVTAHMLRHRYGTRAYQLGGRDLRAVQKLLGHAYITTTQGYVDVDEDAVRTAALAAAG